MRGDVSVPTVSLDDLNAFIVQAKANTYVGGGKTSLSYRPASHDIQFHQEAFSYMDSYFGGTDFIGQEVVYFLVTRHLPTTGTKVRQRAEKGYE